MRFGTISLKYLLLIGCIGFAMSSIARAEFRIRHITPQYIAEEPFKRISEYFTGKEDTGKRIILRTQADQRGGLYFLVTFNRMAKSYIPEGSKVIAQFYHANSVDPVRHELNFPYEMSTDTFAIDMYVGITGADWPGGGAKNLVAWHIRVEDAEGQLIAQQGSYLWDRDEG